MVESNSLGNDFLHPDERGRTAYKAVPGGTIVPPRSNDYGLSPAFNKNNFLEGIVVNIIDDGQVTTLKPGEADRDGNPIAKDPPCNSPPCNSPPSQTSGTPAPSQDHRTPLDATGSHSSSPGTPRTGTSTPTASSPLSKKRGKQSQLDTEMMSLLQQVSQRLCSLESKQSSPMSSPGPQLTPGSKSSSDASDKGPPGHEIRLESAMGSLVFEALDVRLDTEGLVVLVLDPRKPRFLPKGGQEVLVVVDESEAYHCRANDLVVKVGHGAQEVLVVLLVLLETMAAPE